MDIRDDPPPPPPPPPPQLNRTSACDRHPNDQVTGFCASCLRERLEGLDTPITTRPSTSSALKSIFLRAGAPPPSSSHHPDVRRCKSSFLRPEVRRCKSFSANRGGCPGAAFEPQRKSCDVHLRSTLWSLFHQDDRDSIATGHADTFVLSSSSAAAALTAEIGVGCDNFWGYPAARASVEERDEIMAAADTLVVLGNNSREVLVEEEVKSADLRPMKDHIDLDSQAKKPPPKDLKEIAGSFWIAASLFSKKLRNWRRNHKPSKITAGGSGNACSASLPEEEKTPKASCRFRDTHSEIAVDAFGRRSCDIAPRFSLDAGRISFDDPRCTWDEPRASWDGYLIGGSRSGPSWLPPKLDAPSSAAVQRSDGLIPVEEDSAIPGCSEQTRDYYCDSSSRRRRSLDRSSSARKLSSVELVDAKPAPNANASPAELFHWSKLDRESKDWSSNSLREDCSESFDSALRDPPKVLPGKKPRLWSKRWSIWGFIHRRSSSRGRGPKEMERSLSEAWPQLRTNGHNGRMLRSSSSTSSRRSFSNNGGLAGTHRNSLQETSVHNNKNKKKKKEEELVLDKSRSARHSPSHFDNGLLRFYLTPLRGSRRNGGASARSKFSSPRSFTNSILRFY